MSRACACVKSAAPDDAATMASGGAAVKSIQGEPEMKGFMSKKGAVRKNWTRRWFELRGMHLVYYKDEPGTESNKKGHVDLSRCSTAGRSTKPDAHEHELEVVSASRVYRFAAPDAASREAWVSAIRENIGQHGGRSAGGESTATAASDDEVFEAGVAPPGRDDFARVLALPCVFL